MKHSITTNFPSKAGPRSSEPIVYGMAATVRPRLAAMLLCTFILSAVSASLQAGAPGTWTQITGLDVPAKNTDEIGLARSAEGVLHIAWTRDQGVSEADLLHTSISAAATDVIGPDPIVTGWDAINNSVALVPGPNGGLRVFFAGLLRRSPITDQMSTATAGADGTSWSVQPHPASYNVPGGNRPVYAAAGIGAAVGLDGTPVSIWGDSAPNAAGYHVGLDPSDPDVPYSSGCCVYDPHAAIDAVSGEVAVAWNSLADDPVLQVMWLPTAEVLTAPGSAATQLGHRVGMTGRIGAPGIYVAYTAGVNRFAGVPVLWRVGDLDPLVVEDEPGARDTTIAAAPDGRLWVMWHRDGLIYAARSNPAATLFGATVPVQPVAGTQTIFGLTGEASGGPMDILALIDRGGDDRGYWYQRVLPGLSLQTHPAKISSRKGGTLSVTVTDAGEAVIGATVTIKIGRKTLRGVTGTSGKVRWKIKRGTKRGVYRVDASKPEYTTAATSLWVKK